MQTIILDYMKLSLIPAIGLEIEVSKKYFYKKCRPKLIFFIEINEKDSDIF